MKTTWLALITALASCTSSNNVSGSYNGTLTITTTNGNVVVTTLANILPDEIGVDLSSTTGTSNVSCNIQGLSVSGTMLHFDCAAHQCSCSVDATNLDITAATGSVVNDLLTVDFSGEDTGGVAYSATFMGMLEPGTR